MWAFVVGVWGTLKLATELFGSQRIEVNLHQNNNYELERKLDVLANTVREQSAQIYSLVELVNEKTKLIDSLMIINTMLMIIMCALTTGFAYYVFKPSQMKRIHYHYDSYFDDIPRKFRKPRNFMVE